MRRIFWGFCRNWFLMSPLYYLSGRSILASNSRRYSYSKKTTPRYHRYGESPTLHIGDTGSCRLPVSLSRGVSYWIFLKENAMYRWYRESSTPCTSDTVSRRLPVSLSRRVADSAYHRYEESTTLRIVESGSRRLHVSVIPGVASRKKN
jgi:hypothetical protein